MVNQAFFLHNRQQLQQKLEGKLIILAGYSGMQRKGDAAFTFEQEANFYYLTGIEEPDWQLIVDGAANKTWLVAPDVDEIHRIFDGGLSFDAAAKLSGIQEIVTRADAEKLLDSLAQTRDEVFTLGEDPHKGHYSFFENPAQSKLRRSLKKQFKAMKDCRGELAQLRAIKQPEEIVQIRRAVQLTEEAFENLKPQLATFSYEYEIEAVFDYHFKKHGAEHAYDPIVAAGHNACTLHYVANNAPLKPGDLVLLDAGARQAGYAADISRTYAISQSTSRQRDVHAACLAAHQQILGLLQPGLAVKDYLQSVDDIMQKALLGLGLLEDKKDPRYRTYFPHAISHGLGIDVHDTLGGYDTFQPGMVLTVEPGIYIPEENIGVRIEDDVLIEENGINNLSSSLSTEL